MILSYDEAKTRRMADGKGRRGTGDRRLMGARKSKAAGNLNGAEESDFGWTLVALPLEAHPLRPCTPALAAILDLYPQNRCPLAHNAQKVSFST